MDTPAKNVTIIFTGKLLPGIDSATAARRLQKRFPNGDRLVALLSRKKAVVLKKKVPRETALKIKALGKQCGIELVLRTQPPSPAAAPYTPAPPPKSKPPAPGGEMTTCPWCGQWQPVSGSCSRCAKPLAGATATSPAAQPPGPVPKPEKSFRQKFRTFRITLLSILLTIVAFSTWDSQRDATDWNESLHVMIYPINGDASQEVSAFMGELDDEAFDAVEAFFKEQAAYYGVHLPEPFLFYLAPEVKSQPPAPPEDHNRLKIIWWSLRLRYWVFMSDTWEEKWPTPDIRVFAVYHEALDNRVMQDSLGLSKSRTGVVHAFADRKMTAQNKVVIAHEVLHTLGATDKYSMQTLKPDFPDGFAVPQKKPLYPQTHAEIMGGRVPVSTSRSVMPESLGEVVIGEKTAAEIQWIPPGEE